MKIYISADIEGTAGITHWDEATPGKPGYEEYRQQMTREVISACEGAFAAGASEITIKDAHNSGRNILAAQLPENTSLIRGWSGHPFSMMQELDETYDAVLMTGYHSQAGTEAHPLAHSFVGPVARLTINGTLASEFLCNAYTAAYVGVPVVFISGDEGICRVAADEIDGITGIAVCRGQGASTISPAPQQACRDIKAGVVATLKQNPAVSPLELPPHFDVVLEFNTPTGATRASYYPGVEKTAAKTVHFESENWFEVLCMKQFVL